MKVEDKLRECILKKIKDTGYTHIQYNVRSDSLIIYKIIDKKSTWKTFNLVGVNISSMFSEYSKITSIDKLLGDIK